MTTQSVRVLETKINNELEMIWSITELQTDNVGELTTVNACNNV